MSLIFLQSDVILKSNIRQQQKIEPVCVCLCEKEGGEEDSNHKVRTYKEYHSVCPSSELGLSQFLSRQRVFPSPQKQGGGGTLACGWGVGGSPNSDEGHTLWYSLYVRTL